MWLMKEKSKTKTERTNELQWRTRILMAIEMRLVTQTNKQTNKKDFFAITCNIGQDLTKIRKKTCPRNMYCLLSIELKKLIAVGLF